MAGVDRAAIGWTMAIVAFGVGVAVLGGASAPADVPPQAAAPPAAAPAPAAPAPAPAPQPPAAPAPAPAPQPPAAPAPAPAPQPPAAPVPEPPAAPAPAPQPPAAPVPEPAPAPEPQGPVTVSMPVGSAVLGCEQTDECYIPFVASVEAGGTVVWVNDDTAAHTVTSGTVQSGPDGIFDSSLVSAGGEYSYTFGEAGEYPYYCLVHPWMTGSVAVG